MERASSGAGEASSVPASRSVPRAIWAPAAISVLAAAGIAAGLVIGNPSVAPIGEPTHAPAPPDVSPGTRDRLDLPDPVSGEFSYSSTRSADAVAFNGGYVAVGSYLAHCEAPEVDPIPPGCEAALDALPAPLAAVVWLSDDAITWELLPIQPSFEGASMEHIATDGDRLVATGFLHKSTTGGGPVNAMVWLSEDGRSWEAVGPGGSLPHRLVWTDFGFIGARETNDGVQFLASADGRSWRVLTEPGEHGLGRMRDLSVGLDGTTVVATGIGTDFSTPLVVSRDGVTWERGLVPVEEGYQFAYVYGASATDTGWIAFGRHTTWFESSTEQALWTSPDGFSWSIAEHTLPGVEQGARPHDLVWTGRHIVATGTDGAEPAFWHSRDGATWEQIEGAAARLVPFDGWTLGLGSRHALFGHSTAVVWLVAP